MHTVVNINPETLPEEQAKELLELFDELDFNELPEQAMNKPSIPDQFTYRITVETEKWEHTVMTGDESAPEKLHTLLDMLNRIARSQTRKEQ